MTYAAALAQNCGQPGLRVGVFGGGYGLPDSLLTTIAAPEPETTPEATSEATAEATGEATAEATAEPTEEATPEATPEVTSEATEVVDATDVTPEATAEATPEVTAVPEPVVRGDIRTGTEGLILLDRSLGATSLDALRGRTFCRLGPDDFFSWFLPALVMDGRAIDPVQDTGAIVDYDSLLALLAAAADSDCAGIAMSTDAYERLQAEAPELAESVLIADITPAFPYPVMLYPLEVELGVRLTLDDLLVQLADEDEAGATLGWLLGQDALLPADEADFTGLLNYLQAFGLDLARLGNG
jgi:ABC-type phosphate/phosphonate transport system substrate-binding protein